MFRGSILLQVLPVLAVIGEDTASIGNILGLFSYCGYVIAFVLAVTWLAVINVNSILSYCDYSQH